MRILVLVLLMGCLALSGATSQALTWREGTSLTTTYAELEGTFEWDGAGPATLHTAGGDFRLVLPADNPAVVALGTGAPVSVRGISVSFQTAVTDVQRLFWPFDLWSGEVHGHFPQAADQFRQWVAGLLAGDLEP